MSHSSTESARAAGWCPDPTGAHEMRYWDGEQWTDQVADAGLMSRSAIDGSFNHRGEAEPGAAGGRHAAARAAAANGISGEIVDGRFAEVGDTPGPHRQNSKLLKVRLTEQVLAKQGAMVAYQGEVDFAHQGSGATKFLKKAITGEGLSLMRIEGRGDVFLAD